ncbi:MAG: hypothetical protein Q4G47_07385, partial [Lachnospiraceae bacterium]|nr:hypothetical protein [Lachnospiraceae bacterium]
MSKRKLIIPALLLFVFLLGTCMVEAAPKKQSKTAVTELRKEIAEIKKSGSYKEVYYLFIDFTGDKVPEALIYGTPKEKDSLDTIIIIQCLNGKLRTIIESPIYGLKELTFMPEKAAIECMSASEYGVAIEDLVYKNGKLEMLAEIDIDTTAKKNDKKEKT